MMCPISVLRESPNRFVVDEIKFTPDISRFCSLTCGIARQNKWPTTFDYSKSYLHVDELWQKLDSIIGSRCHWVDFIWIHLLLCTAPEMLNILHLNILWDKLWINYDSACSTKRGAKWYQQFPRFFVKLCGAFHVRCHSAVFFSRPWICRQGPIVRWNMRIRMEIRRDPFFGGNAWRERLAPKNPPMETEDHMN